MAMTCRTSDGDLLDTLCYQHYGHLNGTVELVLQENPGLADEPQPYRAGVIIVLPELAAPSIETIELWG
ncbi:MULTISPECIES: tail protein X [Pseudomonas]|uniref:Tail protein X n=1 Tax=Pseudomonas carassii TaxID=3115855 RepID=A0ABU7HDW0_9PSED|nr:MULTISPECIES: tail protein X [Pseudomonas]MBC3436052.1 tail protein X [Pseudomonas sp. BW16M2]MBH3308513.1 tail protein X [Pseudomonas mosselii]MBH3322992.1 tail protein X [Pseudomonas mosselii]MCU9528634.1 tail protein X [Pseudomonas mosselii]MCU9535035.1 tail protein X [Pseudomonas mosselii]